MSIGLLHCYQMLPELAPQFGDYPDFITGLFQAIDHPLSYKIYLAKKGQFPQTVDECDSYIVTGSTYSVYDDLGWIQQLLHFIQRCHQKKKKVLGLCFGHQAIAAALGGKVEKSRKGWGLGVHDLEIVSATPWMVPHQPTISLLFTHQDQVTKLPPGAIMNGTSPFCPYQIFSIDQHIFSLQGHPEFTRPFLKRVLAGRITKIGEAAFQQAVTSLSCPTDEKLVANWLLNFLQKT